MTQQSPSRVAPVEWQLVRPQVSVIEDRWGHIWWLEEDSLVASRKHQHSSQQLSSKDGRLAVEYADDEAEAEANPGQDETVALMAAGEKVPFAVGVVVSVDRHSNQNAQPAHQHGGSREEEPVSLLHGEELEHEDHEGDYREDDGEDHESLHCLDSIIIAVAQRAVTAATGAVLPKPYGRVYTVRHHPDVGNGGDKQHNGSGDVDHEETGQ